MSQSSKHGPHVPKPADPTKRSRPLPWQAIKPVVDDPEAARHVRVLTQSDAYQPAARDLKFLSGEDLRSQRLGLDYLKPELNLRRQGIHHTIVVFGGTRIDEPAEAERKLAEAQAELDTNPGDPLLDERLRIAKRIVIKSRYYNVAREFGTLVGNCGDGPQDSHITLMTGGGPGIMEAANRGADDVGAKSIGLNITLPHEQFPNPYISTELCFSVQYFAIRKLHFLLRAKAMVAFPGGFGTMDELFETLTLVQTRKINPMPIVLVGEDYWRRVFNVDFMVDEGVIDPEDRDLFWFAETAEEIWTSICEWHEAAGTPLFNHRD